MLVSAPDQEGAEIEFIGNCGDLKAYRGKLDPEDNMATESGSGCFYWADRIEQQGGSSFFIDPHKFKIIKDSSFFRSVADSGSSLGGVGARRHTTACMLVFVLIDQVLQVFYEEKLDRTGSPLPVD